SYFDSYLNAIKFDWEEGQIKEITESNHRWRMSFRYNVEELLPKWLNNRFVVPKKRLEKILYQLPTQGTRVLNFSYQDEYLSKVTWSDGLLPVFEASYQSLVSS